MAQQCGRVMALMRGLAIVVNVLARPSPFCEPVKVHSDSDGNLMILRTIAVTTCLTFAVPLVSPVLAAGSEYGYSSNKAGLNNATTNRLVRFLERGIKRCRSLDGVYRYDCYRQNYQDAAGQLAGNPAYALPLATLQDVERTLAQVVARNGDPNAPTVRKGRAIFRAVKPASTAKAKEVFRQALDLAATKLLRSAEGGAHYARIAQALDSNKILLRAMLHLITRKLPTYIFG